MKKSPDFYLYFTEGYAPETRRACWRLRPLRFGAYEDTLLEVRVDPSVTWDLRFSGGSGTIELDHLILEARGDGESVLSIDRWPIDVNVFRTLRPELPPDGSLAPRDLEIIAWAMLRPTGPRKKGK